MMDAAAIRQWLMTWEFWALEALFLAFVVTTALAIPSLVRALGLSRRWYLGLGAIAAGSLVLVYLLPPVTSRIYYDEQIYQDVGQNMADLHRTQMCDHGIAEYGQLQCLSAEYNKEPDGYPYLLSAGYRVFGVSDGLAHHLNRLLQVLLTIVVALTAVRWFGDARAGLLAALFMNLLPEQLRWSATAAAEPSAAFFVLVAVLAAVEFSRTRKNRSLAWLVAATAWAVQFRPEAVFVIGLAALIVAVQAPGRAAPAAAVGRLARRGADARDLWPARAGRASRELGDAWPDVLDDVPGEQPQRERLVLRVGSPVAGLDAAAGPRRAAHSGRVAPRTPAGGRIWRRVLGRVPVLLCRQLRLWCRRPGTR